ncbi:MAG TPA: aldo/keto reductase [Gemmatimonadales bacterium]|nr:aldo/keto reductase [Gemmatimonadales bacterium]
MRHIVTSSRRDLIDGVHDNLRNLGLDALDIVNYRVLRSGHGPGEGSVAEPVTVLAELRHQGLIRHIGLSNVTAAQVAEAQTIAEIAYVPFFPLGGFTPLQSSTLSAVADRLAANPMQVALAWLLHRSPNVLLIPGTSSLVHLRENLAARTPNLRPPLPAILDGLDLGRRACRRSNMVTRRSDLNPARIPVPSSRFSGARNQ